MAPADAGDAHVYHCVQPDPLPQVAQCDDLGAPQRCDDWGTRYAAGATSFMRCVRGMNTGEPDAYLPPRCAAATGCVLPDGGRAWACTCGNGPECTDGTVCVSDTPDSTPYCRCAMQ